MATPEIGLSKEAWNIHGVYVPEGEIDIAKEAEAEHGHGRGRQRHDLPLGGRGSRLDRRRDGGCGRGGPRDPFGHVKLDKVSPGAWFASKFAEKLNAEKVMIQKSGYYSRAAAANDADLALIKQCTDLAVDSALRGEPGVIGHDEENGDVLTAIAFDRIKGGKPFEIDQDWYRAMLAEIGQEFPAAAVAH